MAAVMLFSCAMLCARLSTAWLAATASLSAAAVRRCPSDQPAPERSTSVRVIPYYDGTNDISKYRLDVLYGIRTVDPRLAVIVSGGTGTLGNPSL